MKIEIRQTGRTTSEAVIRSHHLSIDRPVEKGGNDQGPMGGELFLAAVGGCFMSNLLAAINARQAEVSDVQTEVSATLDGSPVQFTAITLVVSAHCEDQETLEKLVQVAGRGCIMMNTLRGKLPVQIRIGARV